eukprot:CCRYP_010224-RA/>CCRYP_010224-RA protein AED:0.05 eAED:0.05 QI:252/1/1/1/1/1/2/114/300
MSDKLLLNFHDAVIYESDLFLLDCPTAWLNDACIHFQMTRLQHRNRKDRSDREVGGHGIVQLEDLFLDPAVISYLMHQCDENDDDFVDESFNLYQAWDLIKFNLSATESITASPSTKKLFKRVFVPINDQFNGSRETFTRPGGGSHWSLLLWTIMEPVSQMVTSSPNRDDTSATSCFFHFDSSSGYNSRAAVAVAQKLLKVLHCNLESNYGAMPVDANVKECKTPLQSNGYDCGVCVLGFTEALSYLSIDTCMSQFCQERYEATLHEYACGLSDKKCDVFASLRKQIGDDIRELISSGIS